MRFTKIVCTIGPASWEPATLSQLIEAGMDVARINFSHGAQEMHMETIQRVRTLAAKSDRPIAILADLQGPKLRIGKLPEEGIVLARGQEVRLCTRNPQPGEIPCQYADLPALVSPGDRMYLDDGLLELEVLSTEPHAINAKVISGGTLRSHKGINLPRADARIPAITEKDRKDLAFAVAHEVDWIALSFVRTAEEVLELKAIIRMLVPPERAPLVVAKIEKPEAVEHLESIIQASDGIMVARGDLGIEMPAEDVPMIQKRIIHLCNQAGKPVITATQMLDSMMRNPRPTRAEATDVANAVLDGTDAVMLSGETAAGKYPLRAVQMMDRIVRKAETALSGPRSNLDMPPVHVAAQAIARAASNLAKELGASAIIAPTASGYTARQLSRSRPNLPIIAVTPSPMVRRQLNLHWGVYPLFSHRRQTTDEVIEDAVALAQRKGLIHEGDLVVITAGTAGSTPGTTNLIKLQLIERILARGNGLGAQKVRGAVRKLRSPLPPDLSIGPNEIVVARRFESSWRGRLLNVCGLVAEEGGDKAEATRLANELNIPAVVGAEGAFDKLKDGDFVILDPMRGLVYQGLSLDDVRNINAEESPPATSTD